MVRVLPLGLIAILSAVVAVSFARPLHHQRQQFDLILPANHPLARGGTAEAAAADMGTAPLPSSSSTSVDEFEDDGSVRSERSTNLSHITGTARKIQMYVRNRHLQILPDGTVNGTSEDGSDYTILQRTSVDQGQVKIQGVATCFFLCMDSCGLLYGSKEYTEDCIFNEMIEQHHYNTYSSARYSDERKTLYLALNKRGRSRKVQIRSNAALGKMTAYTRVLPQTVEASRVEDLVARVLQSRVPPGTSVQHALRHHGYHHLCPQPQLQKDQEQDDTGRDKARCRGRRKRGKKKRKCRKGEEEGDQCQKRNDNNKDGDGAKTGERTKGLAKKKHRKKCSEGEDEAECKKRLQAEKRRRKFKNGDNKKVRNNSEGNFKKKQKRPKTGKKKRKFVSVGEISKDLDSGRRRNKGKVSNKNRLQNQRDLAKYSNSEIKEKLGDNVTMTTVLTSSSTASTELTPAPTSRTTSKEVSSSSTVPIAASLHSSSASPTPK
ncbi:uncharacterized protein bnl [Anabrus simplex]|uniref:uncharacterized protein bnl n=1 Tax=Anabrus simplex TaxID=316456 RepID=UPI0035A3988D